MRLIQLFNSGLLDLLDEEMRSEQHSVSFRQQQSLRSYLSEKLDCDPMRVTKKFSLTSNLRKQYHRVLAGKLRHLSDVSAARAPSDMREALAEELVELRRDFLRAIDGPEPGGRREVEVEPRRSVPAARASGGWMRQPRPVLGQWVPPGTWTSAAELRNLPLPAPPPQHPWQVLQQQQLHTHGFHPHAPLLLPGLGATQYPHSYYSQAQAASAAAAAAAQAVPPRGSSFFVVSHAPAYFPHAPRPPGPGPG